VRDVKSFVESVMGGRGCKKVFTSRVENEYLTFSESLTAVSLSSGSWTSSHYFKHVKYGKI